MTEKSSIISHGSFKLKFKDINYTVKSTLSFVKNESKAILKNISGEFRGNELTAIIGLSGSGKSSLLDYISGFRNNRNFSGIITYNDKIISTQNIKQVSSYFMQEQTLHGFLTVNELMNLSINLKSHQRLNEAEKTEKIAEILDKLNIASRCDAFIQDLSGGETKRLQIAVELVDDPKILFLDEPTTSLDSFGSNQCIQYLKELTKEGRTVTCSIHQPSAFMLKMFDHIYALADGCCIYQGSSENLLNFLDDLCLPCPPTYSPTDFLMEIANNDYGDHNRLLVDKIQNGSNLAYGNECQFTTTIDIFQKSTNTKSYAASYFRQVYYLMLRIFLAGIRDKTMLLIRFGIHVILGLVIGTIYYDIGDKGSFAMSIYHFCILTVTLVLYTSYHSLYATFPINFPIIKREYFNGWYSVKAFYTSMMLFDAPIIFICCFVFVTIVYLMTGQPLEMHRYLTFLVLSLLISYTSQSLGIMLSSMLNVQFTTTFGTYFLLPFFLFSTFSAFARDIHPSISAIYNINYLNLAFKGVVNSVLGFNRTKLECDQLYCHFSDPKKILRDFEAEVDMSQVFYTLAFYYFVCQFTSFILISHRLKYRLT